MKKTVFFLAAAATLAACSKTEVTPVVSDENSEITFNVAPRTKALSESQTDFDHKNVFKSYAYYLAPDKTWDKDNAEAKQYIVGSEISYVNNIWKNKETSYYWPKDGGSLTFFAYSLNKDNMDLGDNSGFSCVWQEGSDGQIQGGINGAIDVSTNKNVDFLVADVAKDKTVNEETYAHKGVPTLFRHRLSMVNVAVNVADVYPNKKFTLNSIKFLQLSHFASYSQIPEAMTAGTDKTDQVYADNAGYDVTSTDLQPFDPVVKENVKAEEGQYIYIPQEFDDNSYIEIKYTVTTTVGKNEVIEECTEKVPLNKFFKKWEMGHKYTINITFTLNEIHWDPAVENWIDGTAGDITIDK